MDPQKLQSILPNIDVKISDGSVRKLNNSEINTLISFKYPNTQKNILLSDKYILYEILTLLPKIGWDEVIKLLNNDSTFSNINSNKKERDLKEEINTGILFGNSLLKEQQLRELAIIEIYRYKDITQEGVFDCLKCKSKNTSTVQKQVRSADESATSFNHCISCNYDWRIG